MFITKLTSSIEFAKNIANDSSQCHKSFFYSFIFLKLEVLVFPRTKSAPNNIKLPQKLNHVDNIRLRSYVKGQRRRHFRNPFQNGIIEVLFGINSQIFVACICLLEILLIHWRIQGQSKCFLFMVSRLHDRKYAIKGSIPFKSKTGFFSYTGNLSYLYGILFLLSD